MDYIHGGNKEELARILKKDASLLIDFSANINPLGYPKWIKEEIFTHFNSIASYPDIHYHTIYEAIASLEQCSKQSIMIGNGAASVLYHLLRAKLPKKVGILQPTFQEYEHASKSVDAEIEQVVSFPRRKEDLEKFSKEVEIIFICNPNNPTGELLEKKELLEQINSRPNCLYVIDESFMDFIEDQEKYSLQDVIETTPNLVLLKSITKFYAIPGLRFGYALSSHKELINRYQFVSPPWEINSFAHLILPKLIIDQEYFEQTLLYVKKMRNYLLQELSLFHSIQNVRSSANFIFFYSKVDIKSKLLEKNIIIRDCSSFYGLEKNWYRICVHTFSNNLLLLNALQEIFL